MGVVKTWKGFLNVIFIERYKIDFLELGDVSVIIFSIFFIR